MTEYICKTVFTDYGGYFEPVRPLVRCKDCKWQDKGENECELWSQCIVHKGYFYVSDDDFCSYAERKEK